MGAFMRNFRTWKPPLSMSSTENATRYIAYRTELALFLSDAARERLSIDYVSYISKVKEEI